MSEKLIIVKSGSTNLFSLFYQDGEMLFTGLSGDSYHTSFDAAFKEKVDYLKAVESVEELKYLTVEDFNLLEKIKAAGEEGLNYESLSSEEKEDFNFIEERLGGHRYYCEKQKKHFCKNNIALNLQGYEVTIRATITKSEKIYAVSEDVACNVLHEGFSVLNDGDDENYEQETQDVSMFG